MTLFDKFDSNDNYRQGLPSQSPLADKMRPQELGDFIGQEHLVGQDKILKRTILFIDEIHRFNKAQQDAFLPYAEDGTIILIGATTENPSFEVISSLLSRCKVFVLNKLEPEEINTLLEKAILDKEKGLGKYKIEIKDETLKYISRFYDGDVRVAYNILD